MWIRPTDQTIKTRALIGRAVERWLEDPANRFTARLSYTHHERHKLAIEVTCVRKKHSGHYCGQHPNECLVNPFGRERHASYSYLEGTDWVGWNDGLNDVLDGIKADCDVWSYNRECVEVGSKYFLRKGRERRLDYHSAWVSRHNFFDGGFYTWLREGEHKDYCGKKAPRADYPEGTPGEARWRLTKREMGMKTLGEFRTAKLTRKQARTLLTEEMSCAEPADFDYVLNELFADAKAVTVPQLLAAQFAALMRVSPVVEQPDGLTAVFDDDHAEEQVRVLIAGA